MTKPLGPLGLEGLEREREWKEMDARKLADVNTADGDRAPAGMHRRQRGLWHAKAMAGEIPVVDVTGKLLVSEDGDGALVARKWWIHIKL